MIGSSIQQAIKSGVPLMNFEELKEHGQKNVTGWWKDLKEESAERFLQKGLPRRKQEEWRYTDLSSFGKREWTLSDSSVSQRAQAVSSQYLLELDGSSAKDFVVQKKRLDDRFETEALVDLNATLNLSGQAHYVTGGKKSELFLTHMAVGSGKLFSPYHYIHVGQNAHLELGEEFLFQEIGESWVNPCLDIILEEGASVDYYQLQKNAVDVKQTSNVRIIQNKKSTARVWSVQTGSKLSRSSFFVGLDGEESQFHYRALSMVQPEQHLDQYLYLDHAVPNCTSRQLFKGIVSERARSVFNGRVIVRKYAQKTDAGQLSKNLLLGKQAEANARPQLEIYADDVKCAHGSTIGRMNPEELFYLKSRGLSNQQAVSLLCQGFAEDVIQNISHSKQHEKFSHALSDAFKQLHIGEI